MHVSKNCLHLEFWVEDLFIVIIMNKLEDSVLKMTETKNFALVLTLLVVIPVISLRYANDCLFLWFPCLQLSGDKKRHAHWCTKHENSSVILARKPFWRIDKN